MDSFDPDGVDKRGGNVANIRFALLTVALASTLFSVQATAQALRDPQPDLAATFVGRALTCSEPQKLVISQPFAERAKVKARLYNLLRESLYDDAKGIVNIAREKEIKHLASKLKGDKARY
jgi:NhaP-type Na+/H+ or K+/H+ antiporter